MKIRIRPPQVTHKALRENPQGTRLYCIASEKLELHKNERGNWYVKYVPHTINMHATDAANAKFMWLQDPDHANHRIVAIGPIIGVYVDDENGDKLRI